MITQDREERKGLPIVTGVLDYFPLALLEVSKASLAGNTQHHKDKPLHWDKSKSTDHADSLVRHLLERGTMDTDGIRHSAKVAWRALALLQTELENEKNLKVANHVEFIIPSVLPTPTRHDGPGSIVYNTITQRVEVE